MTDFYTKEEETEVVVVARMKDLYCAMKVSLSNQAEPIYSEELDTGYFEYQPTIRPDLSLSFNEAMKQLEEAC